MAEQFTFTPPQTPEPRRGNSNNNRKNAERPDLRGHKRLGTYGVQLKQLIEDGQVAGTAFEYSSRFPENLPFAQIPDELGISSEAFDAMLTDVITLIASRHGVSSENGLVINWQPYVKDVNPNYVEKLHYCVQLPGGRFLDIDGLFVPNNQDLQIRPEWKDDLNLRIGTCTHLLHPQGGILEVGETRIISDLAPVSVTTVLRGLVLCAGGHPAAAPTALPEASMTEEQTETTAAPELAPAANTINDLGLGF